ncbi:MAG: hypothetical protein RRZ91_09470, partial [Cetobacterium sp.]|uniref:hypothetical protein n=1 Tax=Cetobacterium sp. TaxID=2071632 RepID=UPI002FC80FFB
MHFFDERLAVEIGVHESIFLQNLYYFSKKSLLEGKADCNNSVWIKMSITKIIELQPYFSRSSIRTIIKKLKDLNLIITEQQDLKSSNNTSSYALTSLSWALMFFLEKRCDRETLKLKIDKLERFSLSRFANILVKIAENLSNITNGLPKLANSLLNLANIEIDNRFLIENRKSKIITAEEKEFNKNLEENYEVNKEIDILILENSTFERRILKTFLKLKKYKSEVIYPAIERNGISDTLNALKITSDEFLQHKSPVAEFYKNLACLNDLN